MTLIPNMSKRLFQERNVDTPDGSKLTSAYDAALYEEMSKPGRGVLVITVICSVDFKNGSGAAATWTAADKTDFMTKLRDTCATAWSEQHRITTTSTVPSVKDVGVTLDVQVKESMFVLSHSHWNVNAAKVTAAQTSDTTGGGVIANGVVNLDTLDFTPENKGASMKMTPVVHEFGHMLGHRDEYTAAADNMNWTADTDAIMNLGARIRERHYAMFAAWLTKQYKSAASTTGKAIDWKVNGSTDLFNAKL